MDESILEYKPDYVEWCVIDSCSRCKESKCIMQEHEYERERLSIMLEQKDNHISLLSKRIILLTNKEAEMDNTIKHYINENNSLLIRCNSSLKEIERIRESHLNEIKELHKTIQWYKDEHDSLHEEIFSLDAKKSNKPKELIMQHP